MKEAYVLESKSPVRVQFSKDLMSRLRVVHAETCGACPSFCFEEVGN